MRLAKARVQNYRSILDSGEFELENLKTIFVGPNEAGKTVLLQALQQLNPPSGIGELHPLRDYPRSKYNDITTGKVDPANTTVVTGHFDLDENDKKLIPEEFHSCQYKLWKKLNNKLFHSLENAPEKVRFKDIKKSLQRMAIHMDKQFEEQSENTRPSGALEKIIDGWPDEKLVSDDCSDDLNNWLKENYEFVDEENESEEERYDKLKNLINKNKKHNEVLNILGKRVPVLILFNNYFKVKPTIHLEHLADRTENNILDDDYYDYGNLCLLKLLGFTARQLSDLGKTASPRPDDKDALQKYRDALDSRSYQLNAASVRLTNEIRSVWLPDANKPEADKLKLTADGQYLKVVVEDDLGVDIELDQRSEGFQWLVSFFIVFFSEAMDKHQNAILLLDEPGMSLHALKQRDFRETISRLAQGNQTIFTTHSPFLVGPNELDIVRVVELKNRATGTEVHTTISSKDPAGLLPLQEALGYDLAHSLFSQQRNLVLEGITDYWYLSATAELFRASNLESINEKIALIFANTAGKVVYYATILHAQNLKVCALLDSDSAGDQAAKQETLIHTLGHKKILRTSDFCEIENSEIEELLRDTIAKIASDRYGKDIVKISKEQPNRSIISILKSEIENFSKYKLAKEYIRWTQDHEATNLEEKEIDQWIKLFTTINKALK